MNKVTIKACFKNNIVNLGKSITSYPQLIEQVKKRYFTKNYQNFHLTVKLYFQGVQIVDLTDLLHKAQQQKRNSVKIDVTIVLQQKQNNSQQNSQQDFPKLSDSNINNSISEENQNLKQIIGLKQKNQLQSSASQQKKQCLSQCKQKSIGKYQYKQNLQYQSDQQVVHSVNEKTESLKSKKYIFVDQNKNSENDHEFQFLQENKQIPEVQRYECYECSEQKEYFQQQNNCHVCNGTGYLDQNHKAVKFVERILNKKIQNLMKKFKFQPLNQIQPKKQQVKLNKQVQTKKNSTCQKIQKINQHIDPDEIKIKVKNGEQKLIKKAGEQIVWQFQVTNIGNRDIPQNVYVRDMKTYKIIGIQGLKINQSKLIKVGPFQNLQPGVTNVQMFQIFYKVSSQVRYPIGPKFGFVCEILKQLDKKVIDSTLFSKINKLKEFSLCEKSSENIIMRLKELGIDQKNIQNFTEEDLIDIIQSCK